MTHRDNLYKSSHVIKYHARTARKSCLQRDTYSNELMRVGEKRRQTWNMRYRNDGRPYTTLHDGRPYATVNLFPMYHFMK